MRRYTYLLIAALFFVIHPISAQNVAENIAMPVVAMANNPVSMGGNQLLLSSPQWSSFSNPAAVVFGGNTFSSQVAYQTINVNSGVTAGLSYKIGDKLGLSAGFLNIGGESYTLVDDSGEDSGITFTPRDMQINFGASYKVIDFLSVGVAAKYLKTAVSPAASYGAVTLDAVIMADLGSFKAAAGVADLIGNINSYSLPSSLTTGVAYAKSFGKVAIKAGAETNYYFYGGLRAGLDAELTIIDIVSVRGGYNISSKAIMPSFASFGLGLSLVGIKLDLSYLTLNGGGIALGLGYCF